MNRNRVLVSARVWAAAVGFTACTAVHGQPIAQWPVAFYQSPNNSGPMTPLAPSVVNPDITATPITVGPGLVSAGPCGGPLSLLHCSGPGEMLSAFYSPTLNPDDYYQFTVTPAPGRQITYQTLRVPMGIYYIIAPVGQRSTGPKTWQLQYSLDGFATPGAVLQTVSPFSFFTSPVGAGGSDERWPTFSVAAVGTRAVPVTFRLYGYNVETNHANGPQGYLGGLMNRVALVITQVDVTLSGAVSTVPCYADCNADGGLTVADFGCFQTRFVAGEQYADCNGDGVRTVADFGCFQTSFVSGCP